MFLMGGGVGTVRHGITVAVSQGNWMLASTSMTVVLPLAFAVSQGSWMAGIMGMTVGAARRQFEAALSVGGIATPRSTRPVVSVATAGYRGRDSRGCLCRDADQGVARRDRSPEKDAAPQCVRGQCSGGCGGSARRLFVAYAVVHGERSSGE